MEGSSRQNNKQDNSIDPLDCIHKQCQHQTNSTNLLELERSKISINLEIKIAGDEKENKEFKKPANDY
eukprot:763837-Hanusia_phi.AAC.12